MATGVAQPLMMLIFGDMLDALTATSSVADAARPVAYQFLMLGACTFCSSYIATYCFTCAGELDV
jgi:muramidase (phage lysozyme)